MENKTKQNEEIVACQAPTLWIYRPKTCTTVLGAITREQAELSKKMLKYIDSADQRHDFLIKISIKNLMYCKK
jgi:hypothetical protein